MKGQEDFNSLASMAKTGDKRAIDTLSRLMYPIAYRIAEGYAGKVYLGDTFIEDYTSEAMIGMIESLKTFDDEKGAFISYASYRMAQEIRNFITYKQRLIAIPKNVTEKISKLRKINAFEGNLDDEELSRKSGLSTKLVKKARDCNSKECILSLDSSFDEKASYIDRLSSSNSIEEEVITKLGISAIEMSIPDIAEDDRVIVFSYFGAFGYEKLPVKTIANRLGISSQMVAYRRNRAMKRLRELAIA